MKIEKISMTAKQVAELLPPRAAYYIQQPGAHAFASFDEEKESGNLTALAIVTYDAGNGPDYTLRFIGCDEESHIKDGVALVQYIEELCARSGFVCEIAGDKDYLLEADSIMKEAGYKGEDTKSKYLEYDAFQFMISPLRNPIEKAYKKAKKLKKYDSHLRKDLAAFAKASDGPISKSNHAKYYSKDGKILGMIVADNSTGNAVYVKHIRIAENDMSTLLIMLSYAVGLAMELEDHTIIFETSQKGLINGLLKNLGEPFENTRVRMYKKEL